MKEEIQCELKDLLDAIHRFAVTNKQDVAFIGGFVAFDKEKEKKGKEDIVKDFANSFLAYGSKENLRIMLNDLRDMVEDETDENGFVNI